MSLKVVPPWFLAFWRNCSELGKVAVVILLMGFVFWAMFFILGAIMVLVLD